MRSLGRRRTALVAGALTAAAVALAGCSAGQVAETANKNPSIYGVNSRSADGAVLVRGLAVAYNGVQGYRVGTDAPLIVSLVNTTAEPVTVTVGTREPAGAQAQPEAGVVAGTTVALSGGGVPAASTPAPSTAATPPADGAQPSPSVSAVGPSATNPMADPPSASALPPGATPSASAPGSAPAAPAPAGGGATISLAPLGAQSFLPGDPQQLLVRGLTGPLRPGTAVNLVFTFSNGAPPLEIQAGVAVPESPASRAPGVPGEEPAPEPEAE